VSLPQTPLHRLPQLSVIIPVWNGERYLAESISSVLEQKAAPALEVIVVDDGSEDQSAAVAERFPPPVRCLRIAHGGLAAARNAGVAVAQGEYLLHLDADDLLPQASIATRMAAFEGTGAGEPADIVVGQMQVFVSPELGPEAASRYRVPPGPQRGGLSSSLIRTSFAAQVGRFDTSRRHSADMDWMLRATEHGARVVEVPTVVLRRRIHGGNLSLTPGRFERERLAIVRAALKRRRLAQRDQNP